MRLLLASVLFLATPSFAGDAAKEHSELDWPQWRGPMRIGAVAASPKLADAWPSNGPKLLWKSEWIPGVGEGGAGSPVVASGKVFLYVNWMRPIGGGSKYRLVTTEILKDAGWLPDLPEALAKKIEDAWAAPTRPNSSKAPAWFNITGAKDEDLDAYIAKSPDLEKYIKAFVATLPPADAKKYGAYIVRRLCIPAAKTGLNTGGFTWDQLDKLSKLRDTEIEFAWNYQKNPIAELFYYNKANIENGPSFISSALIRASVRTDTVVCLDVGSGKVLWKADFPVDNEVLARNSAMSSGGLGSIGASGTPAVFDNKCYFAGAMGLYCISTKDGALIWQVKSEAIHASPLMAKGLVYHYGVAYSAADGKIVWKNPLWKPNLRPWEYAAKISSPVLWATNGHDCIITTDGNRLWCCLELETGKVLWTVPGAPNTSCPVFSGDIMILRGAAKLEAFKVTFSAAEPLWQQSVKHAAQSSCLVSQDNLFVSNSADAGAAWSCLELKSGQVKWTQDIIGDTICTVPALADSKIINVFGKGHYDTSYQVEMIKASPEKYERVGLFNPKACMYSSPAIADGRLFLRLLDGVACYDLK
ncbi:MAG: PQQ-binding-like beta-propeller repeat protein [Planctomycetes bacterium]|nr:PQQ-binding-like beta-propeller repeat protein [Planctomycetota bacterium]